MEPGKITLQMVADEAGCSLSTASKAFSGAQDVAPMTRRKVISTAARLGYKHRSRRKTHAAAIPSVSIAFDVYGSLYSSELLVGALAAAMRAGHEMDLAVLPEDSYSGKQATGWLDTKIASGHSGAVLVTSRAPRAMIRHAQENSFPLVCIDPIYGDAEGVVSIGSAGLAGVHYATEHLIELGHTKIGFAGLDMSVGFSAERYSAYFTTLQRHGHQINSSWVFEGTTDYETGFKAGQRITQMNNPPTGVVCINDTVAFGVIEACRRRNVHVPTDLSVVGFDDVPPAKWSSPALTTVRQPLRRIGGLAVRTLLRLVQGEQEDSDHIQLATELVVRQSTAPPANLATGLSR